MPRMLCARLVLVLLALAVPLATVHGDDNEVANWVKRLGGKVTREGNALLAVDLRYTLVKDDDPMLKKLAELQSVKSLDLSKTFISEKGLKEIAGMKNLQQLNLSGSMVSEDGLKELKPFKNLQLLTLNPPQITDKALGQLKELDLLHALPQAKTADGKRPAKAEDIAVMDLRFTRVADAGFKDLAGLKGMHTLHLEAAQITNAALGALKEAELLHVLSRAEGADGKRAAKADEVLALDLRFTAVTSEGLKELAGLKKLQSLALAGTAVGDDGLKELAGFTELQTLNLADTKVSDAGLDELARIKSLQMLYLYRTPVTAAAVKKLQSALPECRVLR